MTYLSNIVTIHITSSALFNADSDGFNIQNNIQKFGVEIGVSFDGAICTSSNSQITSDFLISENNSTSIFESNKQLNYLNYQQVPALHSNSDIFVDENTIIDDYLFDNIIDRQKKLVELGHGYLVFPGGYGTHYETLEVITKNDIGEASKPIFILNTNGIFDGLIEHINKLISEGFITRLKNKHLN